MNRSAEFASIVCSVAKGANGTSSKSDIAGARGSESQGKSSLEVEGALVMRSCGST